MPILIKNSMMLFFYVGLNWGLAHEKQIQLIFRKNYHGIFLTKRAPEASLGLASCTLPQGKSWCYLDCSNDPLDRKTMRH